MKLIRRFFTYLITIVAVLVLTYGYVYWDDLFSEDTPAGQLIGWMLGKEKAVSTAPEPGEPLSEPVIETATQPEAGQEKAMTEPVALVEPVSVEPPLAEIAQDQPIVSAGLVAPVSDLEKPDVTAVDDQAAVVSEPEVKDVQEISTGDLWKHARHSFHYRDYQASIDSYQQLITRTQDNFDAYEELGDVYAYYGKNDEAADAYFQAASILVRLGKLERAAGLMKPLSLLDVSKARALLDQLAAAQTK